MRKLFFVPVAAIIAAYSFSCKGPSAGDGGTDEPVLSAKPHVVLIVLDTLRADALSCYGGPNGVSPEIDALAATGVRFARVTAPSNWTKPSWATMLTGRHPRSLGVYKEIGDCLPDGARTLAEAFRDAGYRTYGATANPNVNSTFNFQQGFDEYRDSHVIWDWMALAGTGEGGQTSNEAKLAPATELFAGAAEWAAEQQGGPCYIQICTMEMHEYHRGPHSLNRPEYGRFFSKYRAPEREYFQALKQSSADLHEFLSKLRALPGWQDMLVVVTSDHGEGLSDHPDVSRSHFHGGVMYDSNLHVPLILHRLGALPKGHVVDRQVRLLDLAPTLLALAGIPAAANADGVSLGPLIDGTGTVPELPEMFVSESYLRDLEKITIANETWRYIENRDQSNPQNTQRGQLNSEALQRIGARQNGVVTDQVQANSEIAAELRNQLRAWEAAHPKADATVCAETVSDDERDQLEAIGYW